MKIPNILVVILIANLSSALVYSVGALRGGASANEHLFTETPTPREPQTSGVNPNTETRQRGLADENEIPAPKPSLALIAGSEETSGPKPNGDLKKGPDPIAALHGSPKQSGILSLPNLRNLDGPVVSPESRP
jgi:hypothetical protein